MPIKNVLQKICSSEIDIYKDSAKLDNLKQNHIPFTGHPNKHPYDPDKIILISDPLSPNIFYYEFEIKDIAFAQELSSIVNMEEETVTIFRIWIKRKSIGVRATPFIVEDTRSHLK